MTQEEKKRLSLVQIEIMDEIHRICMENSIQYYMIGGTLLGAVRHGGYIPWDVDIDIALKRSEYIRFKNICRTQLGEKFDYWDCESDADYSRPHAIIVKRHTKLSKQYDVINPKTKNVGIYLDVFPLDNAPDDLELREKQAKALKRLTKFKQYRIPYSYSYKVWKRYIHYAVSFLLSWIPIKKINQLQQNMMMKYDDSQTTHICSMASRYAYSKQCMPREIYGEPVLLAFEGRMYYAPAKYEEYLTRIYGDYMKLPPVEKRLANLEVFASVEF